MARSLESITGCKGRLQILAKLRIFLSFIQILIPREPNTMNIEPKNGLYGDLTGNCLYFTIENQMKSIVFRRE